MSCLAAMAKVCTSTAPPHNSPEPTCGFCLAAKSGYCESHGRGALKALEDFAASLKGSGPASDVIAAVATPRDGKPEAARFAGARAFIESELANIPDTKHVEITAHAYEDIPDMTPRGIEIKIVQARE